ncbi:hypothetical protein [Lentzea xinjiangensis]|uniref:hypothetical protein n=1 Tax=Lentzea xinjiangensis TaxID=402600 RepID=UPI000B7F4426|nr:hypothetical protein [Lentzea xinjiangensis]
MLSHLETTARVVLAPAAHFVRSNRLDLAHDCLVCLRVGRIVQLLGAVHRCGGTGIQASELTAKPWARVNHRVGCRTCRDRGADDWLGRGRPDLRRGPGHHLVPAVRDGTGGRARTGDRWPVSARGRAASA